MLIWTFVSLQQENKRGYVKKKYFGDISGLNWSTQNICFIENWRKLFQNYHQILLLYKFSVQHVPFSIVAHSISLLAGGSACRLRI